MDDEQPTAPPMILHGMPGPLDWAVPAAAWRAGADWIEIRSGRETDLFISPADGSVTDNASRALTSVDGDFRVRALVTVDFGATFDAGGLLAWVDARNWAKVCFEQSPQGRPMIVSVVTRGVSDDANAWAVDGHQVWLRVSRRGPEIAFHASSDGTWWDLVRTFAHEGRPTRLGFEAQSPTGQGCSARFESISFEPDGVADIRHGS
jgi:regulation of enolase protein 1 (concanavalin A-like superfamily)